MPGRRSRRPVDRHDFKIGIICVLGVEADAVEKVFDERWDKQDTNYGTAHGDPNVYTTGVIADQNVVLAYCPYIGSNIAAQVAASMRISFTGIELIIVVGVCGVVPFYENGHLQQQEDIFLGDCLVSTAVVHTDLGRREVHGFRIKEDLDGLGRSGRLIAGIMSKFQTNPYRSELTEHLKSHLKTLQEKNPIALSYPGAQHDRLYCEKKCTDTGCGNQYHELRVRPENENSPNLHFGYFGSSNTVLKSGTERDGLAKTHKIIAFEMESSGVWEVCQTIVIKAACDYADSHKNKIWQKYAAAVAASGLKAFLAQTDISDKFGASDRKITRKSISTFQYQSWDIASHGHLTAAISADFKMLAYGQKKAACKQKSASEQKATRERNATILVHKLKNGSPVYEIKAENETEARSLAFDSQGKWLASSHGGYWYKPLLKSDETLPVRIRLWNMETGQQEWLCQPHQRKSLNPPLLTMSFNSEGDRLAVVYSSNDRPNTERPGFFIIDVNSGEILHKSNDYSLNSRMGHYSPDDMLYFLYLEKEIAVFDVKEHQRVFPTVPTSSNDTAVFKADGSLAVTYHNGDLDTYFQDCVVRQKLGFDSNVSFDKNTRILGRFTVRSKLVVVMTDSHSQRLYVASPEMNRCRALSSPRFIAKVLDISPDGQYLAWCEMRTPDSTCQIRVCNVEDELQSPQSADIKCYLDDVD